MSPEILRGLQTGSLVLAVLLIGAGAVGMVLSFLYLASVSIADITAGASGFVAGALFIAAGLISLTILSVGGAAQQSRGKDFFYDDKSPAE